ncbi:hypothetical protein [uncultured Microbacterium sp.]|uniref:hypothetical protein n=1 Tax=uncultured Microbacterium sp. TaxID=191216 RepID=UPI0025FF3B1A|nr:hypothetical protein [uncultured Microbacterium sp.]
MSVLLDEETVILEGLDFEERCDAKQGDEHAAHVMTRFRCCGSTGLLCTPHMENQRVGVNGRLALGFRIICGYCETDVTSWEELVEVVPL